MKFPTPLERGTLIKRYKRFMADVTLEGGDTVTAHCANPGSMLGLNAPGSPVWLSRSDNPKRKLKFSWELIEVDLGAGPALVGINTSHPNGLVAEAIESGVIGELIGDDGLRREVRYGKNSRIDILLEDDARPPCYVEVKNVHMKRGPEAAEFPDSVTTRGTKHLGELAGAVREGARAVMFYLVQRGDCGRLEIAADIDPAYDRALRTALSQGVEAMCYSCAISPGAIELDRRLPVAL